MTRIYLVRHAVHGLVGKALAGRMPGVPLSQDGVRQAEQLRDFFVDRPISRILSSPIERTRQTAEILAAPLHVDVELADGLSEIDCGEWTGKTFEELAADRRWEAWNNERDQSSIPGGEGMAEVQRRAQGVLDGLGFEAGPVMLVSHSDVIKAVVAGLTGMPFRLHDRIEISPASVTTVDLWEAGKGKILCMNQTVSP